VTTSLPLVALIDDDLAVLKAVARLLRASGFEAATYRSAEDFLTAPPAAPPVCLVLDLKLGGMSGLDLLRRLRALQSGLSIIVMTGGDDPRVREEVYRLGCAGYFPKQADAELLVELIRSLTRGTWPKGVP
jgi:FixJ family two-component response regulator